jgi:predicted DNA-binding transcriptional regulator AlpA
VSPRRPPRPAGALDELPLVLFVEDVARLLGTSRSSIYRALRARTFPIPQLASVDRKPRWSRLAVVKFLEGHQAAHLLPHKVRRA